MKRTYSKNYPQVRRLRGKILFPIDIKEEAVEESAHFSFLTLEIDDLGQDITNQEWKDAQAKQFQHDLISENYENSLADGCPSSLGFKVDCMPNNVSDFHQSLSLLSLTGSPTILVRDYDNQDHMITSEQFMTLCQELGTHVMSLRQQKWTAINALK